MILVIYVYNETKRLILTLQFVKKLYGCENFGSMFRLMNAQIVEIRWFEFPEEFQVLVTVKHEYGYVFLW